jgi:hypothetical protein
MKARLAQFTVVSQVAIVAVTDHLTRTVVATATAGRFIASVGVASVAAVFVFGTAQAA